MQIYAHMDTLLEHKLYKTPSEPKHLETSSIYEQQADFLVLLGCMNRHTVIYKAFFFI